VLDEAWRYAWERDVEATVELVAGDETRSILAVADEIDADAIVLGRGRRLRRPRVRLGALRHAARNVLLVGPDETS